RRLALGAAHPRELLDPCRRVEGVPAEEAEGRLDRPAVPAVLVAPVLAPLRSLGRLEVEVGGSPRRPGCAREDHAQDVAVAVLRDDLAEVQELGGRVRRVPLTETAAQPPPAPPERPDAAES